MAGPNAELFPFDRTPYCNWQRAFVQTEPSRRRRTWRVYKSGLKLLCYNLFKVKSLRLGGGILGTGIRSAQEARVIMQGINKALVYRRSGFFPDTFGKGTEEGRHL